LRPFQVRWRIYSLLSKIYEKEPTVESLQNLLTHVNNILTHESELLDGAFAKVLEHVRALRMLINDLLKQDSKQTQSSLAKEYAHLLLGFRKHHPSESSYRSDDGSIMQEFRDEVVEAYKKFGVRKAEEFKGA
jgi:TorA maturation chaperone TorD